MKIVLISSLFCLFSAVLPAQQSDKPAPNQPNAIPTSSILPEQQPGSQPITSTLSTFPGQQTPIGQQPILLTSPAAPGKASTPILPAHQSDSTAPNQPNGSPTSSILPGAAQMNLYLPLLQGKSVAVFANQTSLIGKTHLVDTLLARGIHIKKIFAPEHGFRGDADAGEQVSSLSDPKTGLPIISLYGSKDQPSAADLQDVDIMLFDIQDVGVRFYTYISSLQKYLESAIANHRPVIILDRPNPNGFYVDGPVLTPSFKSFVGMQPIPVVYGMTIGEYGQMLLGERWLDTTGAGATTAGQQMPNTASSKSTRQPGFHLTVIPCRNYTHKSKYMLPVPPSPNLPNMQAVYLYPSLCFFEGTAISLGRGTDKPFQQYGAPSFRDKTYQFTPQSTPGAKNPPLLNQICYGYDLSQIDVTKETGNRLSLKWLLNAYQLFPDKDRFFLNAGKFFNKLAGTDLLQQQLKEGETEAAIRQSWEPALTHFKTIRKKYLLYPE